MKRFCKTAPRSRFMKSSVIRLIERMVIILVLYTLMRAIFFVYNNDLLKLNDNTSIWNVFTGGFQFDVSAILYTNILFILLSIVPFRFRENTVYQKICKWIFLVVNGLCIIINMMDVAYYRFTLKRTTTSVFSEFRNENPLNFVRMIWDYRTVSLMILILIVLMTVAYKQTKEVNERYRSKKPFFYYGLNLLWMGTVIILTIGGMRGGLAHSVRPITLSNASAYTKEPQQRAAVLNTPFSLIRTIGKKHFNRFTSLRRKRPKTSTPLCSSFQRKQRIASAVIKETTSLLSFGKASLANGWAT